MPLFTRSERSSRSIGIMKNRLTLLKINKYLLENKISITEVQKYLKKKSFNISKKNTNKQIGKNFGSLSRTLISSLVIIFI